MATNHSIKYFACIFCTDLLDLLTIAGTNGNNSTLDGRVASSPASLKPNYDLSSMKERMRLQGIGPFRHSSTYQDSSPISSPEARRQFDFVQFEDIDSSQKMEFEKLLEKVYQVLRERERERELLNSLLVFTKLLDQYLSSSESRL